jgi:uncharacterized protein
MRKLPVPEGEFWPLAGPIALVTTVDEAGHVNVAPKSWISMVARNPRLAVMGCHRQHHTARNLLTTGECVLNFPGDDLVGRTWEAHHFREPGPGEPEARGFTPVPALQVAPPRLKECRAHLECRLESVKWYGDECVLFLTVVAASADAAVLESADPAASLRPIFYLGEGTYGVIDRSAHAAPAAAEFVRYVITLKKQPGAVLSAELVRAHVAHLQQLEAAGQLVLCGPFADGLGGMVIIRAESEAAARAIAEADPFVASGAESYELRTWELSCAANNHMGMGG